VQGPLIEGWPRGEGRDDAHVRPLAPSRVDACNPLLQAHPTWARDKHEGRGFSLCTPVSLQPLPPFTLRLAPTHLGWGTRRQFTRRPRDPPGSKCRQVVTEGASDEGAPATKVEQAGIEEGDADEEEIDYNTVMPSKPSHLDFGKSTVSEADMPMMIKLGYFGGSREEADSFWWRRNHSEARK
jgi:hypothetical protein